MLLLKSRGRGVENQVFIGLGQKREGLGIEALLYVSTPAVFLDVAIIHPLGHYREH